MPEEHELSFREIEQLSWYDLNAHLGVPYFHQGGLKATDRLADLCATTYNKHSCFRPDAT